MTNTPNARPITVSYVDPISGLAYQRLDGQGFDFNGGQLPDPGRRRDPYRWLFLGLVAGRPLAVDASVRR